MSLLLQLFAPTRDLHRLIYVFACSGEDCINATKNTFSVFGYAALKTHIDVANKGKNNLETVQSETAFRAIKLKAKEEPESEVWINLY